MKDKFTVADDLLFKTADAIRALDESGVADDHERARRELEIYSKYFRVLARVVENPHSDGKTETARAYVGRHVHPGYTLMPGAIDLIANHAAAFPPEKRLNLLDSICELMLVIGVRWRDAECAAMNIQMHLDRIKAMDTCGPITQPMLDQMIAECKRIERSLRDNLKAMAEILMNGTAQPATTKIVTSRADKGRKHSKRTKPQGWWRSAADVADDFNHAAFIPEPGAGKMGACSEEKVNRWDRDHPDVEHKNRFGYYATLRIDGNLKGEYYNVLAAWRAHWETYKAAFTKWRKTHPNDPRDNFRFRPLKRTDIDPARIGKGSGGFAIEPRRT